MAKAVIDTNVIVSGLIRSGNPRQILRKLKHKEFTLALSPSMFEEIVGVLRRPRISRLVNQGDCEEIILFLELSAEIIIPTKTTTLCRDPEDNHILVCAQEAKADFIVSGDKDLLVLKSFHNIPIVTPKTFLACLKDT